MRRAPLLRSAVVLAFAGSAVSLVAFAPAAQAAPTYPSGYHLTAISHTAFRVGLNKVADTNLTSYRLVASTDTSKLTAAYLNAHSFRSSYYGSAKTNEVTLANLAYTTEPYYYRAGITYGRYKNYVAWGKTISSGFGLAPTAPTGVQAVRGPAGYYLKWTPPSSGSTGAAIDQTNLSTGTTGTYTIHGTTGVFTPYGMGTGTRYSYKVRAMNIGTHSPSSASSATFTNPSGSSRLRLMSYNVLGAAYPSDITTGKALPVAGWTKRVTGAASLVTALKPDVLTVQEGDTILGPEGTSHPGIHAYPSQAWPGNWWSSQTALKTRGSSCNHLYANSDAAYVGGSHYWPYRQVDSLCDYTNKALGSSVYTRAVDGTPLHNGSSNYLIYNKSTMAQLTAAQLNVPASTCWMSDDPADVPNDVSGGRATASNTKCGGYFSLESSASVTTKRNAAWAVFQLKANGTRLLVVSPHLSAELGSGWDARRSTQVKNLLSRTRALAAKLHINNITYGGDFNTYAGRPGLADTTTPVLRAAGDPDAIDVAHHSYNTKYLSGNQYTRTPLAASDGNPSYYCLDHIVVTPGMAVQSFGEELHLNSRGQFADAAIPSDHNPVWADLYIRPGT